MTTRLGRRYTRCVGSERGRSMSTPPGGLNLISLSRGRVVSTYSLNSEELLNTLRTSSRRNPSTLWQEFCKTNGSFSR
jgi:hypothetical protein